MDLVSSSSFRKKGSSLEALIETQGFIDLSEKLFRMHFPKHIFPKLSSIIPRYAPNNIYDIWKLLMN